MNKKHRITIGAVAVVALIAVIAALALRPAPQEKPPETTAPDVGGRGLVALPENIEEIQKQLQEPVQDGYYETRMSIDWVFQTSKSPSENVYVENSTNNKRTVYFDLILPDTNELIYSSPFIPVGAKLENFALNADLPAGEYTPTVIYHLVDDDFQEITTVSVSVSLRILG
jgi:hypothetical protein